jgi:intein/homing endonuclease
VSTDQGEMTLEDVVSRLKSGEKISILSYNERDAKCEMKPVVWGDVTRKNAKVIELRLKDGKSLRLTSDHKVYTDKGWMEAGELKEQPGIKILCV